MDTSEIDAYVRDHNAKVNHSSYTLWKGRGSRRRLVGRADSVEEAVALAHQHAPCSVWAGTTATEPCLVTSKRQTKKGENYTVEVRGSWAGSRRQADCDMMAAAVEGKPSPVSDLRRARQAAAALRAGYFRCSGVTHRVAKLNLRILADGTVRVLP